MNDTVNLIARLEARIHLESAAHAPRSSPLMDDMRKAVAALTASQARIMALEAENERLGDLFDDICYCPTPEARTSYVAKQAAKAEARADALEASEAEMRERCAGLARRYVYRTDGSAEAAIRSTPLTTEKTP